MKKRIGTITLSIIAISIVLGIVFLQKPFKCEVEKVRIRNGVTGENFVFEGKKKDRLMKMFKNMGSNVSGINVPTMGYSYWISITTKDGKKDVFVFSKDKIGTGFFRYKTHDNIIRIIEENLEPQL